MKSEPSGMQHLCHLYPLLCMKIHWWVLASEFWLEVEVQQTMKMCSVPSSTSKLEISPKVQTCCGFTYCSMSHIIAGFPVTGNMSYQRQAIPVENGKIW